MKQHGIMVCCVALALAGCGGDSEIPRAQAVSGPPIRVSAIEARTAEWPADTEVAGTIRAVTSATLASKVMGSVREVKVNAGDQVAAGQLLVAIDDRELEAGLLQAKAAEQETLSGIAEAENGIAAAKARLALARATFTRMSDLFRQKSISNQEFDETQARFLAAEADYHIAVSKRSQFEARIAQAKQAVASASVARGNAEIRAPFRGVITEKRTEAGQMAMPGAPLLTVEQNSAYRIEAPVEESLAGRVRLHQTVAVVLQSSPEPVAAKITEIVPAVDSLSRSFVVKAALPRLPGLRSGSFARVRIPVETRSSLLIPAGAIVQRGDLQSVFVVDGNVARLRIVTSGQPVGSRIEILSGLREGEKVVYPGSPSVGDGSRVEVR